MGFILWLTGLSGVGKSTLARAVGAVVRPRALVEILDGDEMRTCLSKGLSFSKDDRDTNVCRIGYVARLLARNGVVAIAATVSPYAEARAQVRHMAEDDGVPFVEVHVHADMATLVERDVKGLYAKALAGEIANFTGVSAPYEAPAHPEIVLHTDREPVEASLDRIVNYLRDRCLLDP